MNVRSPAVKAADWTIITFVASWMVIILSIAVTAFVPSGHSSVLAAHVVPFLKEMVGPIPNWALIGAALACLVGLLYLQLYDRFKE